MGNEAKEAVQLLIPEDSTKGLETESHPGQSNRFHRNMEAHAVRRTLWTQRQVPEFILKDQF